MGRGDTTTSPEDTRAWTSWSAMPPESTLVSTVRVASPGRDTTGASTTALSVEAVPASVVVVPVMSWGGVVQNPRIWSSRLASSSRLGSAVTSPPGVDRQLTSAASASPSSSMLVVVALADCPTASSMSMGTVGTMMMEVAAGLLVMWDWAMVSPIPAQLTSLRLPKLSPSPMSGMDMIIPKMLGAVVTMMGAGTMEGTGVVHAGIVEVLANPEATDGRGPTCHTSFQTWISSRSWCAGVLDSATFKLSSAASRLDAASASFRAAAAHSSAASHSSSSASRMQATKLRLAGPTASSPGWAMR